MNLFFILAGAAGLLGAAAHGALGHRWTVGAVDPAGLNSTQFEPETDRRFLMWFWQVGTVVLAGASGVFLLEGLGLIAASRDLLWFAALLWLAITLVFLVIASRPPSQLAKMPPGLAGIVINALIFIGLLT